ncbi:Immediate early response gene 5-like protein [Folsomia candida]|uniref:Immediate early response gene 5-like protein n=2 Tax=Folsomia candida TaxID=158441 RepID=A0A226DWY8_FOLCA|nr:Immediate early response gene 5-like protein [Folsomia candida]
MGPEDLGLTDGSCVVLRHPSWSRELALFPPRDDLNLHSRFLPNELKLGRSSVDPNLECPLCPVGTADDVGLGIFGEELQSRGGRQTSGCEGEEYQPPISVMEVSPNESRRSLRPLPHRREDRGHVLGYNLPECRVVLTRLPEVGSGSGRASGIEVIDLTCSAVGTVEVGHRTEMQPGSSGGRGTTGGRNYQVQYSGPVSSEEEEDLEALFVKVKRVRKEKKSSTGAGETERSANQAGGSGRVMAEGKTRIKARSKKWFRRRCPCGHVFIAMDRWRYHLKNCNGGSCNQGRCHLIGCQGNPNPEVDYRRRR